MGKRRGSSTGRTPHASGLVRLARLSRHAICSARFPPAESQAIPASKALNTWYTLNIGMFGQLWISVLHMFERRFATGF